jgi:hypothetical protein
MMVVGVVVALAGCGSSAAKSDGGASPDSGGGSPDVRQDLGGGGDHGGCVNSLDCGSDQVCNRDTGQCVQCLVDADCKAGMGLSCIANKCQVPTQGCKSTTDCAGMASTPVCDLPTGRCIRCLSATDCPMNNDCTSEACVPYTTCMNSLGCPQGQVCDTSRMRCVQCVGDNDCATTQRCALSVCRLKCTSDNMCTSMGMLCDISHGYCVGCLTANDCKPEQYCSNGTCVADICMGGSSLCQNNAVAQCRTDGSGYNAPTTCSTGQTCTLTNGMASCKSQVCTPTVTYCDPLSEKILVCSADGLTSSVKSDCASSSQVCVAGACAAVVCPAGTRFCQGQELRQCSTKGDASTLTQTCTATQYCDMTTLACKAQVCTPNQPGCSGNVMATCNADGSGFLSGGTLCDPKFCVNGACSDGILNENFENGSYSDWTPATTNYTISATSTPGANATNYALSMTKTLSGTTPDGLFYSFSTGVQPKSISYWVKSSSTSGSVGYFSLSGAAGTIYYSCFACYLGTGYMTAASTTYNSVSFTSGIWYHVELRNIDWSLRQFDLYINSTQISTARLSFSGTSTAITRIDLFNVSLSTTGYWDEIQLLP